MKIFGLDILGISYLRSISTRKYVKRIIKNERDYLKCQQRHASLQVFSTFYTIFVWFFLAHYYVRNTCHKNFVNIISEAT